MNYIVIPELVDGCHMRCALCWNRNRQGSMENMSLDIVYEIVKKYGHVQLCWYNWGEPLWHKQFVEVSEAVKNSNSSISSNFSLPISEEYLWALLNWKTVCVSLSGTTQAVYEIYNKGGNLGLVFSNIERLVRTGHPSIVLRWESHNLNKHQINLVLAYCTARNIIFEPIALNCEVENLVDGFDHELLRNPKFNQNTNSCNLLEHQVPIGVDGSYLLCCASHNVKTGFTIFDAISMEDLLHIRMNLPLCKSCREREFFKMY
jgi:organic radical activating enzyme